MTRTLIAPLTEAPDHQLEAIAAAGERLLERVPEFHTLNARQQAFLTEYVTDFNASRAASAAGYSSKGGIARALYFIRQSRPYRGLPQGSCGGRCGQGGHKYRRPSHAARQAEE